MHTQVKKIYKIGSIVVVVFAMCFFYFYQQKKNHNNIFYQKNALTIGNDLMHIYKVDTPLKRKRGLSVMNSLLDNEAMLFIFDSSDIYPFWMKDMKFDIDIVWLNENKEVVFIKEHARVSDYPNSYTPDKNSLYVVEFVDGFVEKNNIKIGDVFKWE